MATNYPGIDYGRLGQTNRNTETGIHYGVIPLNDLNEWAIEDFEADYGPPTCGKCGNEASEGMPEDEEGYERARGAGRDYHCETCKRIFGSEDAFRDEPLGWSLENANYTATMGSDNDIFVIKSPYFTHAQFCSPCAPGAGYLLNPCEDGPRCYCFGHDWFEGNKAPYPVYRVSDGTEVKPE